MRLTDFPDADTLLALDPSELASPLLAVLKLENGGGYFHIGDVTNFQDTHSPHTQKYAGRTDEVGRALMEAHGWLRASGLIARRPGNLDHGGQSEIVTRRGWALSSAADFASFVQASRFPTEILHGVVHRAAWSLYQRGDYDTAVFAAMKQVEVAVRSKGGFADTDVGVSLMRAALKPGSGPLRDRSNDSNGGEQEAEMHLFGGAIG